ncbi:Os02g0474100 [Oryza sativa Japonica Group]|uniref:Os02g0474100 protein n=1 Tax=Oryza sativa subsp. japonica TaxID=39947 RepID=A0A0P0VIX2_ORYSJ|nr:Os02g0474100 [Oryza sativa Japonica Group]
MDLSFRGEGERAPVYRKTLADGLRIVDSEVEINVMNSVCNKIKNFVIYFDHTDHVSGRNHEDILLTPAAELPEVFSPTRDDHQEPNLSTNEHTAEVNQKPKGIEEEEVEDKTNLPQDLFALTTATKEGRAKITKAKKKVGSTTKKKKVDLTQQEEDVASRKKKRTSPGNQ